MSKNHWTVDFDALHDRVVTLAFAENIATSEDQLTIRNVITHLDFDVVVGTDKITYSTRREDRGRKVMLLYQFSYVPKDASPQAAQNVRRPFAMKVTKNNNLVYSIQSVKEMNEPFLPLVAIHNDSDVDIEFGGYDGTADIFIFGLVAESHGDNMNG